MRLTTLRIDRAPGISAGYEVTGLEALNVIHGPNGSGKSTLVRALRALLWPERERGASRNAIEAAATFVDGDRKLLAVHRGGATEWQDGGQRTDPPHLPSSELASCFTPSLSELLKAEDVDDLAGVITRELAGGFDLEKLAGQFRVPPRKGDSELVALRTASDQVREVQQRHEASAKNEERLPQMRHELSELRQLSKEAQALERALDLFAEQDRLTALEVRFAALPSGLDLFRGDESDVLKRVREQHERDRKSVV